jgi:hypothetical protein
MFDVTSFAPSAMPAPAHPRKKHISGARVFLSFFHHIHNRYITCLPGKLPVSRTLFLEYGRGK